MSRIRTIKPDFFLDDQLAELSPLTRLLFIGLWTIADCKGRMEDRPKRIRAQLHPFDDGDTDLLLQALHDGKFICRYVVDGKHYLEIRTFTKHQRLSGKESEIESELPAPPLFQELELAQMRIIPQGSNGETLGKNLNFPNVQEWKGKEGERKGKEKDWARAPVTHTPLPPPPPMTEPLLAAPATPSPIPIPIPIDLDAEFEALWCEYPQRNGGSPKNKARRAWDARRKEGYCPEEMRAGVQRYAAWCTATGKLNTEFIKQASTFLGPEKFFTDPWVIPAPTPARVSPRNGQRVVSNPFRHPNADRFDTLLRNLNQTVIEGELAHELH